MSQDGAAPRAKPEYFDDPAVQALYQMVLILGEELAVTREHLHALTALCAAGTPPSGEALAAFQPDEAFDAERAEWVARLLEPLNQLRNAQTDT